MEIHNHVREVKEVNSFLDETYSVSIVDKGVSGPGRISWARIGCEKFYARTIPQITGSREAKALASVIRRACYDAIVYGNSTIYVFDDGSTAVSDPLNSVASRNAFGDVLFQKYNNMAPLGPVAFPDLIAMNGILMAFNVDKDINADRYVVVGRSFSIFFKKGKFGSSRITPAIRRDIRAQARTELRIEESEDFFTWPQRILNGVWDGFAEDMGDDVAQVVAGIRQILAIPENPDTGAKVGVDSWSGGDFTRSIALKESRMKSVAAAFNISPDELGFTQSQFSSAEAIHQGKEDLVLEIQEFTSNATETVEDFLEFVSVVRGIEFESFSWANPSTPSIGSRTDAFIKLAGVIPQLKYSKAAILEAGLFSPAVVDDLFKDLDAERMIKLSTEEAAARLQGEIDSAGGEDA